MPDTRGATESRGEGTPLSSSLPLSLSDGPNHSLSLACEFPPSKAHCTSFHSWFFALFRSLMLSLPLPSSCLCSSVVTLFRGQEHGGGGGRWLSSPLFFPPQLHHSIPTVLVPLFLYTSHSRTIQWSLNGATDHPSWGFLAKWGKQIE